MAFNLLIKDTHTLCSISNQEALNELPLGTKLKLTKADGSSLLVTTKADKKGGRSSYMTYLCESHAFCSFIGGASKGTPVPLEVEVLS